MQLRLPGRLILINLLIFLSLAVAVSAAQANTYTETFSGPLNLNIWEVFSSGEGVTINVTGGELVITIPAHATGGYNAGIRTKFNTGTAFQSQVDYNLVTWPQYYDWTIQAGLWSTTDPNEMNAIRSQHYESGWHEVAFSTFHGNQYMKFLPADNRLGSLRLWRNSGGGVGSNYNIGSGWQAIGSLGGHNGDEPFMLQVRSGSGAAAMEVHFDNFIITGVNVPNLAAGLPAADLLLLD